MIFGSRPPYADGMRSAAFPTRGTIFEHRDRRCPQTGRAGVRDIGLRYRPGETSGADDVIDVSLRPPVVDKIAPDHQYERLCGPYRAQESSDQWK